MISEAGVCETQHVTCLSFVLCGPIIDGTFPNSNGSVNLLCTTQVAASKKIKKDKICRMLHLTNVEIFSSHDWYQTSFSNLILSMAVAVMMKVDKMALLEFFCVLFFVPCTVRGGYIGTTEGNRLAHKK